MFNRISLKSNGFNSYKIINTDTDWLLDNLKRINIFIGTNNSGKSRLLRELFGRNDFEYEPSIIDVSDFKEELKSYIISIKYIIQNSNVDTTALHESFDKIEKYIFYPARNITPEEIREPIQTILEKSKSFRAYFADELQRSGQSPSQANTIQYLTEEFTNKYISILKDKFPRDFNLNRHYIPILRSLKDFVKNNSETIKQEKKIYKDLFKEKTVYHYFNSSLTRDNFYDSYSFNNIFTGLSLYDERKKINGEGPETRDRLTAFENFLSKSFFNNQRLEIIARNDEKVHVRIGDDEFPIEQLGDGVQSIIILTYPLFMHLGENAIFFFDEPETHLHPGFQRLFIETLRDERFNTFQYFISTHSNHFLDITLEKNDTSIYTFEKSKKESLNFTIENVASGDNNILKLIGANKSSVFLSNRTIWVEGITDRMYLRKYLDLYQDQLDGDNVKYKEDYHYSFVEYGGSNITHWSFLDDEDEVTEVDGKKIIDSRINIDRLCSISFVVTDSDNAADDSEKKKRQEKLENLLGEDRFYCLKGREIENLLTKEVVVKTIKSYDNTLKDEQFKKFIENFNTADKVSEQVLNNITDFKPTIINKKSKNFYNKAEFANKAVEQIETYEEMSNEAKLLVKKLYDFIKSQNT